MTADTTEMPARKPTRTLMQIVGQLRDMIDLSEGEVTDDVELLELALAEKVEAYRYIMRELEAEAAMLDELARSYGDRANHRREKAEALKLRLEAGLSTAGVEKLVTPTCTAYFQSSKRVALENEGWFLASAEDRFIAVKQSVNKTAVKEALEAGEVVEGAAIKTSRHLRFR